MTARKLIICVALAAALLTGALMQKKYVTGLTEELIRLTDEVYVACINDDPYTARERFGVLYKKFVSEERMLFSLLEHDFICDIDEQLLLLTSALGSGDTDAAEDCCMSLKHSLLCIRQLEDVHAENIF